jgi:hypothetical protein
MPGLGVTFSIAERATPSGQVKLPAADALDPRTMSTRQILAIQHLLNNGILVPDMSRPPPFIPETGIWNAESQERVDWIRTTYAVGVPMSPGLDLPTLRKIQVQSFKGGTPGY